MSNEDLTVNPIELLRMSVDNGGDLSGLTQSLITASALLIKGDESWVKDFNELIQVVNNELFRRILSSFLEVIRVVKTVNP